MDYRQGAGSITTVAERLKPESVYDRFVAFRAGLGVEVLPASSGASSAFAVLAQRLRAGRLVALVCDRDVTGSGIEVEFFGVQARMMGGPAALAVQTGVALMPMILCLDGDGWGVHVHQQIPVPAEDDSKQQAAAMTQELARLFEAESGPSAGLAHAAARLRRRPCPRAAAACGWQLASVVARPGLQPARQGFKARRRRCQGRGPVGFPDAARLASS
jgi:Bacterial lipid A biosynthesis acyltransferase